MRKHSETTEIVLGIEDPEVTKHGETTDLVKPAESKCVYEKLERIAVYLLTSDKY